MRGLYGLKNTTTSKMQLSRLHNKRAQNEAGENPGKFHCHGAHLLAVRRKVGDR